MNVETYSQWWKCQGDEAAEVAVLLSNHSMSVFSLLRKFPKPFTQSHKAMQTFSINDVSIRFLKAKSKAFKRDFDSQQFQSLILELWKEWHS